MAAKVFGWLGTSRRQSVLSSITHAAQSWWDAWAIGATTVDAVDTASDAGVVDAACVCFEAHGHYALRIEGDLAAALTSMSEGDGGELSAHVTRAALSDLARRLGGASGAQPPVLTDAASVPETLGESRWGGTHFVFSCGSLRLCLWLDRQAADHWAPRNTRRPAALMNRLEAAAPVTAHLRASLDLGEISLEELHGLVPGDVIATSAPLTRPIDVAMAHGQRHVFHGQLGERGGRRALRLLSPEVPESHS